jgi:hypothetical protein
MIIEVRDKIKTAIIQIIIKINKTYEELICKCFFWGRGRARRTANTTERTTPGEARDEPGEARQRQNEPHNLNRSRGKTTAEHHQRRKNHTLKRASDLSES